MRKNIINWFKLNNCAELKLNYQLVDVKVEGVGNDVKLYNKSFYSASNFLSYESKGPVSETYYKGKRYLAVKGDAFLKPLTLPGNPLNIILTPIHENFSFRSIPITEENLGLALRFLESSIKYQLNSNLDLWDGGGNVFLKKIPLEQSRDIETDIYYGFKFKLVAEDKNNIFICVDLAYKYVDKFTLYEILKELPKQQQNEIIYGKNFIYQNGDNWYTVKGKAIGSSIDKYIINIKGKNITIFDYILNEGKYSNAKYKPTLFKDSETFIHSYLGNNSKSYPGATCLAKRIRYAEDDLHKLSINEPNKRFSRIEYFVKGFFKNLKFNGVKLDVEIKPHQKEMKIFKIKSLKFGNNTVLNPYEGDVKYGQPIDYFPKRRREFIYRYGIISDAEFTPQHLFLPDDLPTAFSKSLKFYFDSAIIRIAPKFPGFTIQKYSLKSYPFAYKVFTDLKKYIDDKNLGGSSAIFVLPGALVEDNRFNKYLHNLIKKELFDLMKIKCISASKLLSFFKAGVDKHKNPIYYVPDGFMRDFKSYRSNTLFEHLIENRKWLYAFAENLNYDLYIGVDAHEFYAGFCFFFKNGEKIVFDVEKTAKRIGSFRNEKVIHSIIADKIVSILCRHLKVGNEIPKSIIVLKDGDNYGEEEKALGEALQRLHDLNLINKENVKLGIIDVAKSSSVPIRAASYKTNSNTLENLDSGNYFYNNKNDAFIFNTGFPYKVPGTSNPIHVSFSSGNIDFNKALDDIFQLTQISFSAPDRPTSLPLPLKLIDTIIRDVANEFDLATTQEKEINIFESSLN